MMTAAKSKKAKKRTKRNPKRQAALRREKQLRALMRGPIPWYGGKSHMVKKLLPLIPPHHIYVEVFGGGAAMLFAKEPSPVETYNDLFSPVVTLFRVLRDRRKARELRRLLSLTPYSREEHKHCTLGLDKCRGDVASAFRFFVAIRQGFGGRICQGWGFGRSPSSRGMAQRPSSWLSAIDGLPAITERLLRCQIECADFRRVIRNHDSAETFFYCDPPYVTDTRRGGDEYAHELADDDHRDLTELLLHIEGMAMLSGYRHALHDPLEDAGWLRKDFRTVCNAAGRTRATGILGKGAALKKQPRVESVWLCPRTQERLRAEGRL